ncbi:MAG TPA: hypothetical protein VFG73_07905 [Rhodanobacteraceae bacterium]|nr:hypothetical protein [Rhodanobacteraceae bacterium]
MGSITKGILVALAVAVLAVPAAAQGLGTRHVTSDMVYLPGSAGHQWAIDFLKQRFAEEAHPYSVIDLDQVGALRVVYSRDLHVMRAGAVAPPDGETGGTGATVAVTVVAMAAAVAVAVAVAVA